MADLSLEQNLALNNLKQAWRYVLDEPHAIDFRSWLDMRLTGTLALRGLHGDAENRFQALGGNPARI